MDTSAFLFYLTLVSIIDIRPHYAGRHLELIQRRKEAKSRTLQVRRDYNRTAREQGSGL